MDRTASRKIYRDINQIVIFTDIQVKRDSET